MRNNRIPSVALAMLLPLAAVADSYTSLWKKFDAACAKDHPQTALRVLADITQKASHERAYGQLIKAQYLTADKMSEISTDSIKPAVERMCKGESDAERSGNMVVAAIYQSVLGYVYTSNSAILSDPANLVDASELGKAYYSKSMEHPDALAAAYATSYAPVVVDGVDSKFYYDDMLHVIGMRAGAYRQMHDYYASHGKREAACLTALELVRQARRVDDVSRVRKSRYIASLDSLAREYGDLVVCGEVAIERYGYMENADDVTAEEKMSYINYALMKWGAWPRMNILRNAQKRLTLPSFHVSLGGKMALPGVTRDVRVMELNNIGELRLTATRLDVDGTTRLDPEDKKDYATLLRHIVPGEAPISDVRRYVGVPAYKTLSDTLQMRGLRSGVYLVELSTDNVSVPVERKLLHVCNLYPMIEALPGKRYRVVVLNATTGMPVEGAKLDVMMSAGNDGKERVSNFVTDANGEVYVKYDGDQPWAYRVYADGENAFPLTPMAWPFRYYEPNYSETTATLYTDRRIYRPGQTVHVAAIAYKKAKKGSKADTEVARQAQFDIIMRDANAKEVARHSVVSDDYGMASADFVVPQGGLMGTYSLLADYGNGARTSFSVEEYKRPTFKVEMEKPAGKYAAGDTISLKASAKSFAGVPVQGAKVAVRVMRRPAMFWRFAGNADRAVVVYDDTLRTAQDGTFDVRVPVVVPDSYEDHPSRYYAFDVTANVTDAAGETRYAETSLPYSDRPTLLTCDVPEKSVRDSLRTIRFNYVNNAGEPIEGTVAYSIDSKHYTCKANTDAPLDTDALSSARHKLVAVCGSDTLTTSFLTFSLQDAKAPIETHDWFYQSAKRFPADGSPIYVQMGSSDSIQHVVYTLLSGDKVVDEGRVDLKGELRTRAITYKEEWGDGIVLSVAWVKSGHSYTHTAVMERPELQSDLKLQWTTFRDRLSPGQRETWTLKITRPDGTPAKAQLLATMYDKSLDEIKKHSMPRVRLDNRGYLPWLTWQSLNNTTLLAYSEMPMRFLNYSAADFSHIDDYFFDGNLVNGECFVLSDMKQSQPLASKRRMYKNGNSNKLLSTEAPMASKAYSRSEDSCDDGVGDDDDAKAAADVPVRENLQETAFFFPGLLTDGNGNVALQFTLPESVTTWQMYGLAHDDQMNMGEIAATSVAKKTVMVQPNVPRFVRSKDKGVLSTLVANTSGKNVSGTARLAFVDPSTGKEVYGKERKFDVKAGQAASVDFDFDMSKIKNDGLLICRVTASGSGYSDGEQHYLPVLPDKQLVVNTRAFSQNEPGTLSIDVKKLFAVDDKETGKLTIEYTNSPAWFMIQALPSLSTPTGDNAISLVSAYYANALGKHIMSLSPIIKQTVELWKAEAASAKQGTSLQSALQQNADLRELVLAETPWLMDADRESEQKQQLMAYFDESQVGYRLSDLLGRLRKLQRVDGSFAWWSGMEGSPSMTMAVAQTLARLKTIVGNDTDTHDILNGAFGFMDKQMASEVKDMKKSEKEGKAKDIAPSQIAVEYLYASTIARRQLKGVVKANFDYLVAHLLGKANAYSIYGKGVVATILAKNGHTAEADDALESLRQYTVYDEEMGRYFDSPKAQYSWFDYRIPSQVAAIEAFKTLKPADKQTISEMQRWLLQSKRTQMWDTPLNSVNAIYAFLGGNVGELTSNMDNPATIKVDGRALPTLKATTALGYVKTTSTGANFKNVTIEKTSAATSWGAVYAQFMQPTTDVGAASTGLTVERVLIKDGQKVEQGSLRLDVGDRLTVRLVITALRDYDFVQVSDSRAACLEPLRQLSGYGHGYYCEPKDYVTNYFFDRLAKGRHVIETTYYVDRKGTYNSGTCSAQCAYAPEFMGRAKAVVIDVRK